MNIINKIAVLRKEKPSTLFLNKLVRVFNNKIILRKTMLYIEEKNKKNMNVKNIKRKTVYDNF